MKPITTAAPLLAALIWTAAYAVDPGPLSSTGVLLMGIGLIAMTTIGVVGLVLNGGRWAYRLLLVSLGATAVLAVIREIDGWWIAGVLATALSFIAVALPATTSHIKKLPSATGPPTRAVLLPLVLIGAPLVLGLVSLQQTTWATAIVGLSAPVVAFWFARVLPGGLFAARFLWPLLALVLSPFQPLAAGLTSALLGLGVAVLAWHPSTKAAFHPPRELGSTYAIPPELAPEEILDAAGLDDRGKRK